MSSHLTDEENETVRGQVTGSERLIWVFSSKARVYNSFTLVPSRNYTKAIQYLTIEVHVAFPR